MAVGWIVNKAGTVHTNMELTTKNGSQIHSRDQKHHRRCEVKVQGSGDLVQKTWSTEKEGAMVWEEAKQLSKEETILSLENHV